MKIILMVFITSILFASPVFGQKDSLKVKTELPVVLSFALGMGWSKHGDAIIEAEHIFFIYNPPIKYEAAVTFCLDCQSASARFNLNFKYRYEKSTVESWTRADELAELTSHTIGISPFTTHFSSKSGRVLYYADLININLSFGTLTNKQEWNYVEDYYGLGIPVASKSKVKPSLGYEVLNYGMYLKLFAGTYLGLRTVLLYNSVKQWEFEDSSGLNTYEEKIYPIDRWLPVFVELKIAPF